MNISLMTAVANHLGCKRILVAATNVAVVAPILGLAGTLIMMIENEKACQRQLQLELFSYTV